MGDLHDTCNDLCHFRGFDGCDAGKIAQIKGIPRGTRLLEALSFTCEASSSRAYGPTYQPTDSKCFYGTGVDRPLCFCSTTTATTTSVEACRHPPCVVLCRTVLAARGANMLGASYVILVAERLGFFQWPSNSRLRLVFRSLLCCWSPDSP